MRLVGFLVSMPQRRPTAGPAPRVQNGYLVHVTQDYYLEMDSPSKMAHESSFGVRISIFTASNTNFRFLIPLMPHPNTVTFGPFHYTCPIENIVYHR